MELDMTAAEMLTYFQTFNQTNYDIQAKEAYFRTRRNVTWTGQILPRLKE
jgi:hypothetical protein